MTWHRSDPCSWQHVPIPDTKSSNRLKISVCGGTGTICLWRDDQPPSSAIHVAMPPNWDGHEPMKCVFPSSNLPLWGIKSPELFPAVTTCRGLPSFKTHTFNGRAGYSLFPGAPVVSRVHNHLGSKPLGRSGLVPMHRKGTRSRSV